MGKAQTDGAIEFTLAFGIGEGHHTAAQKTMSSLATPFAEHREPLHRAVASGGQSRSGWRPRSGDGGKLMRASHNVLLAHEDKTYSGAFVASASIPWGQAKGDDDLGGYHLVWTRDMVQTATALLACGRAETARRALVYLACTQQPDGGFAQNFWIDGTPYWSGLQLDEVAFPLILAWRLWKAECAGRAADISLCRAGGRLPGAPRAHYAAGALGRKLRLLAFDAGGGDCRADLRGGDCARPRLDGAGVFLEEFADWIEKHLEDWTVTNDGVLHPEVKRHYMRIRPPESGEAYACESCGTEIDPAAKPAAGDARTSLKRARLWTRDSWNWCATACGGRTIR